MNERSKRSHDRLWADDEELRALGIDLAVHVSTLANYLEATGGRLEFVGVFDGKTRVTLSVGDRRSAERGLGDLRHFSVNTAKS